MYTFESRVRFSEADHTELLTLPGLVNYFQDCSTIQSEDIGYGVESLKKSGQAWILSAWQIVVNRYPKLGEYIRVSTWATDFTGLFGLRNFKMEDEAGEMTAWANSVWVYMDMKKGRPCRPAKEEVEAYRPEAPLDVEFAPRKIVLPKELEDGESFPVRRHQIDTNEHVNNCQYIQMAIDVVPECERAGQIRVEYKKSAVMGDIIYPKMAVEEQRKIVELCDAEGNPYAVVEFKEK